MTKSVGIALATWWALLAAGATVYGCSSGSPPGDVVGSDGGGADSASRLDGSHGGKGSGSGSHAPAARDSGTDSRVTRRDGGSAAGRDSGVDSGDASGPTSRSGTGSGTNGDADSGLDAGSGSGEVVPAVSALASMVLAFDDEFDGAAGTQPDTSKWQFSFTGQNMTDYSGGELIDISLPRLDGEGHVVLPGQYNDGSVSAPASYSAGCIITKGYPSSGYQAAPSVGDRIYMEWRAELPAIGAGVWPAIWAISNGSPYTEVDIMEQGTGIGPTPPYDAYFTYWTGPSYQSLTKVAGDSYSAAGSPSLTIAYHIYSTLWTTTDVTWYIDGTQAGTAAIPATDQAPVAPIANFQIGGAGGTPEGTGWPRYFTIDYVRVFRDTP
jgi:Glycosyl hydrolases family 16